MSFLANPDREAVAPDGTNWHIRLVRGNAWLGWRWTDRVLNAPGGGDDGDVLVVALQLVAGIAEAPPAVYRWLTYRLRRRRDWRVLVWSVPDGSARTAKLDERLPTKPEAADQAMRHLADIRSGSWSPGL